VIQKNSLRYLSKEEQVRDLNESEGLFLVDWYVDLTTLTSLPFFTTTLEEKNNVYFVRASERLMPIICLKIIFLLLEDDLSRTFM
jgi:hypothetical protein